MPRKMFTISRIRYFVLEELDSMVDMEHCRCAVSHVNPKTDMSRMIESAPLMSCSHDWFGNDTHLTEAQTSSL